MANKRKKILIADDEKNVVELLEKSLTRLGFAVFTAGDGVEAKNRILEESPDLVILDLVMPRLDGWEVLKWLRQERRSDLPVIIVSGKNEVVDVKYGYDLEADSYLTKPIDLQSFLNTVNIVTSKRRKKKSEEEQAISSSLNKKNSFQSPKVEALINLLHRKGLVTKKEIFAEIENLFSS